MVANKLKMSNLIKFLCVMFGAVFALSSSVVYAVWSWKRTHTSGYATGAFLPNQSYQIVNDSLPNGIPYGTSANEHEIALEYSYDYDFDFYVKYSMAWYNSADKTVDTSVDSSNVILTYSNRDAWIVDGEYWYYRDTVRAGTGKLPIIVGVDFVNDYDEDYNNKSLKISVDEVKIVKSTGSYTATHDLYKNNTSSIAAQGWLKYKTYTTITGAYIIAYDQTKVGNYKPAAPGDNTAYRTGSVTEISASGDGKNPTTSPKSSTIKKIYGNKNYMGLGVYVITGNKPITLKAKVKGAWLSTNNTDGSAVYVNSNTIKYNYSSNWENEAYESQVDEIREFKFSIPAHSAVYIPVIDSVEQVTRGLYTNSDYSSFYISTTLALLNSDGEFIDVAVPDRKGVAASTITGSGLTKSTTLTSSSYSVVNASLYDAALYRLSLAGEQNFTTHIRVVNNTANALNVNATYSLKAYISNGNSLAEYGQIYNFTDTGHWARDEVSTTGSTHFTVTDSNKTYVLAPYSAQTIAVKFTISNGFVSYLTGVKEAYGGSDVWGVLIPTITASTSSSQSSALALEVETSGTTATLYVKNMSTRAFTSVVLSALSYQWFDDQKLMSALTVGAPEPSNWSSSYWVYYIKDGSKYVRNSNPTYSSTTEYYSHEGWQTGSISQITFSGTINPGEKVRIGTATISSAQIYNFSGYTLTGTATTAADVQLVNETTGKAYLINNSANASYYVRMACTATNTDIFHIEGGKSYFLGLIRPGQVIPVEMSASTANTQIATETIKDTTGELPSSLWTSSFLTKMKNMYKITQ